MVGEGEDGLVNPAGAGAEETTLLGGCCSELEGDVVIVKSKVTVS